MALDVHAGLNEELASKTEPICYMEIEMHNAIFNRNENYFKQYSVVKNLVDFYLTESPYLVAIKDLDNLLAELLLIIQDIDNLNLSLFEKKSFVLFIECLLNVCKQKKENLYFAFD